MTSAGRTPRALPYGGGVLDRAARNRREPGWLREQLGHPNRRDVPL